MNATLNTGAYLYDSATMRDGKPSFSVWIARDKHMQNPIRLRDHLTADQARTLLATLSILCDGDAP